ncbi:DUF1002 domain-containing protein [Faecalicatena contorta]|uniref:DUF1002 domain-containing protein n=1 Tax=Faecalicatena contorta TaxID=39482 RepID=UPI001F24A547|nr:DUF1002 domain-containing protein [Faecalicatena contorta]MCF2680666.1 DUF1002 domain-containing protein [Faecalicatena contorta]
MKQFKKIIPFLLVMTISAVSIPLTAKADSAKVVTLGANLSDEQKNSMYEYFGTSAEEVETIEVNNADERKYMEGIATEAQIGTRTYSCSYVEPTESGGIQVKVANLTFVTSSMIASTLLTSGVENCNVVAASPIEVSGTGALTGIMMAYETASGEELDEDQKATATEELITTGELADTVGQQEATELMNEVKQDVIEDGLTDPAEIQESINDAASDLNITLTEDQMNKIVALMQKISQYDYDVNALKDTLDNLEGKSEGFFSKIWSSIKGFFSGDDSDGGIINNTNDALLGDNAVIDSTLDAVKDKVASQDGDSLWDKIVNFFKSLFGEGEDDDDQATINAPSDDTGEDAATVDSNNTDTPDDSDTTDSVPSDDTADDAGEDLTINTEE